MTMPPYFAHWGHNANSLQSTAVFNIASLGWLSIQAIPLILWPQFVASLLETGRIISRES